MNDNREEQEVVKYDGYNMLRTELGALATGMFYDAQEARKTAFNRIRQVIFRKVEGIAPSEKQGKKEDKDYEKKFTDKQVLEYIKENKHRLSGEEQRYVEKIILLLDEHRKRESEFKKLEQLYIEQEPIYQNWLKDVRGISTLNTANLLQYFGYCEKAKHASSLWKFAGLHVVDGRAPKKERGGGSLDWNPKLRMLMYRVGDCFIKMRTPGYRDVYDRVKEQELKRGGWDVVGKKMLLKDVVGAPQSLGHADNRARRVMVKRFLADYFERCRLIRGLGVEPVYSHRFDKPSARVTHE